jgi:hypothetical protein
MSLYKLKWLKAPSKDEAPASLSGSLILLPQILPNRNHQIFSAITYFSGYKNKFSENPNFCVFIFVLRMSIYLEYNN